MRVTLALGAILAGALVGTVAAQDYIYSNFKWGYQDHVLPQAPCSVLGSVQPVVYDHSIWMTYTCADGRVVARRFIHPNDSVRETVTVQTGVRPLAVTLSQDAAPVPPTADPSACNAIGMVPGVHGGCVPANHPSAAR